MYEMRIGWVVVLVTAMTAVACRGNQPPPRRATAPASSGGTALTAEQLEEIQRTVKARLAGLSRQCYDPELEARGESFSVETLVKILIGTRGVATRVEVGEAGIPATFRRCIVEVIKGWEFPALSNPAWFSYPLSFSPAY